MRRIACLAAALLLTGCSLLPLSGQATTQVGSGDSANAAGLKVASQLSPKESAEACFATAKELHAHGHTKEAIILFERARGLDPHETRVFRYLAVLYDQEGNDTRALSEFQKALKATPKDPDLLNDLGYYFYRRSDWKQAEDNFRKAIAQSPDHERAWVNLGLTLGELGRYKESYQAFAKVEGPAAAHSNLGVILAAHGHQAEAQAEFEQAIGLQPDLPQARAYLAHYERSQSPPPEGSLAQNREPDYSPK